MKMEEMITQQDVLDAFDSHDAEAVQAQALKATLEKDGRWDIESIVNAINESIASGVLVKDRLNSIRRAKS